MIVIKNIVDFITKTSLWVAFAVLCFVKITNDIFLIKENFYLQVFVFFGVILGYNFIKYFDVLKMKKILVFSFLKKSFTRLSFQNKFFVILNITCLIICFYCFFKFRSFTKILLLLPVLLTLFYAVSFGNKTLRNIEGLKIYIVGFTWAIVTVLLPIVESDLKLNNLFFVIFTQRFIITIILILPFEIRDLKEDDKLLKTVPQKIGVNNTKYYGVLLVVIFCLLDYYRFGFTNYVTFVLAIVLSILLLLSKENQSKYFTSFVVEGVPILWYLLLLII